MGISKNRGIPKWMVYNGKPYQNGWFGGTPIFGNIYGWHTSLYIAFFFASWPFVSGTKDRDQGIRQAKEATAEKSGMSVFLTKPPKLF